MHCSGITLVNGSARGAGGLTSRSNELDRTCYPQRTVYLDLRSASRRSEDARDVPGE